MPALAGLLVDYGGVLTTALSQTLDTWCAAEGIDPVEFGQVMRDWSSGATGPGPGTGAASPVHALETGQLSVAEFERALAARLRGRDGAPVAAAGLLARMFAGFAVDPAMLALLRGARRAGLRTALVSNSWGLDYPRQGWDTLFDAVVISGEVGLRKPDPDIYLLAAERVGLDPARCVFVDDLASNVRGAAAVGMVGVRHVDPATTRAELEALFGVPLGAAGSG